MAETCGSYKSDLFLTSRWVSTRAGGGAHLQDGFGTWRCTAYDHGLKGFRLGPGLDEAYSSVMTSHKTSSSTTEL